ncbi:MAG TPA: hypothetical protein VHL08_09325 [Dongiaceae bacterium]|jgi:hypothetical protein|nr:hypothetical protein [Dongiaceae bacterium]
MISVENIRLQRPGATAWEDLSSARQARASHGSASEFPLVPTIGSPPRVAPAPSHAAFLAQHIAQEYLDPGLTIEPYVFAASAYGFRLQPPAQVDFRV